MNILEVTYSMGSVFISSFRLAQRRWMLVPQTHAAYVRVGLYFFLGRDRFIKPYQNLVYKHTGRR